MEVILPDWVWGVLIFSTWHHSSRVRSDPHSSPRHWVAPNQRFTGASLSFSLGRGRGVVWLLLALWESHTLKREGHFNSHSHTLACEAYFGEVRSDSSADIWEIDQVALGGWFVRVVADHSWSLLVPRRLGNCDYVEAHVKVVWCSGEGFVRGSWAQLCRRKLKSIPSGLEAYWSV